MTKNEAENYYRAKFDELGFSKTFEFVSRDWASDHGRKVNLICKACGCGFSTWAFREAMKGRQARLICPSCGSASDGSEKFSKTSRFEEMKQFYLSGHSVRETAEQFKTTKTKVNNYAKQYGWHNGKSFITLSSVPGVPKAKSGRLNERAKRVGAQIIDKGITVKAVYDKYSGKCCVCGKKCSFDDKRWGSLGPDYPTRGHIIPNSKGGAVSWKNIWLVCGACNIYSGEEDETHYINERGLMWDDVLMKYI